MANGFESLRKLADVLSVETARTSGDPQRLQLALGEVQAKKLQETEAALNQAIDESNIPDSQKRLLKALDYQSKAKLLYEAQKPKEPKEMDIGDYKAYLANKILNKIPLTTEDKELEAYLKNLDAIERLKMGLPRTRGGQISQPSPKSYSSVEAVEEDYRAGILKIGDTVSLNGLELEVDPKAFE
jgi:hypothetical protein